MGKYQLVVLSNAVEGLEDEYNDWYTNRHLNDVVAIPGFTSAQRFRYVGMSRASSPVRKYLAIYEVETDDPEAAIAELTSRSNTELMPLSPGLGDDVYAVMYEPITDRVTQD